MLSHKTKLDGAIITIEGIHISMLMHVVAELDLEQFTVVRGTGHDVDTWTLSAPVNKVMQKEYAGLIHRQNTKNKLKQKVDGKGGKPDNDPTPPKPTGGGQKVVKLVNTKAIAA